MPKNKRRDIKEDEFFGFAKSYLSEAFPNPQRIGCLADSDLARLAEHPTEADISVSQHLTGCSLLQPLHGIPFRSEAAITLTNRCHNVSRFGFGRDISLRVPRFTTSKATELGLDDCGWGG